MLMGQVTDHAAVVIAADSIAFLGAAARGCKAENR